MKAEAFKYFTDQHLTVTGLILFAVLFIGIVVWTSLKSKQDLYKKMSQLPLEKNN